jgi:lysophospholipase-2
MLLGRTFVYCPRTLSFSSLLTLTSIHLEAPTNTFSDYVYAQRFRMTTITYQPREGHPHTHTIIFLHGRDSEAEEFSSELFESEASPTTAAQQDLTLPALLPTVRWVFPTAPILRSERFDVEMSQWFDMWSVEDPEQENQAQHDSLNPTIERIVNLIKNEERDVPRNKVFLCGISQGFAAALTAYFAEGQGGLAGLVGLCSWMPFAGLVEQQVAAQQGALDNADFSALQKISYTGNKEFTSKLASPADMMATPVFLAHASDDEVVPVRNALRMKQTLAGLGLVVEWHEYQEGGHWVNEPQGVDDMVAFVNRCMAKSQ